MNDDLKTLFTWLCANRLSLNVAKTEFIIFKPARKNLKNRITLKLNGKTIFESKKIKYLIVDNRLSWNFHIHELCKKLSRIIGILFRLKKMNSPKSILSSIYFALFKSQISYGLMAWGTACKYLTGKILLLQKRAVRIISNARFNDHTEPLFKQLQILKLSDLFKHQIASFMYEYDHNDLPEAFNSLFHKVNHSSTTRSTSLGKLALRKTNPVRYGGSMI